MKRIVFVLALSFAAGAAMADVPAPVKIPIRHADPWAVKALLEGMSLRSPEMSTIPGFQGLGQAAGNAAGTFIKNGRLVVNPTDNSLWFFPDRE